MYDKVGKRKYCNHTIIIGSRFSVNLTKTFDIMNQLKFLLIFKGV